MTTTESPNLPIPSGAYEVDTWHSNAEGIPWRPFRGAHHDIDVRYSDRGYIRLQISGEQYADGKVERYVSVGGEFSLFPAEVHEIAGALIEMANQIGDLEQ